MGSLHQAFVFDDTAYRRNLAPLLDREDDTALEAFLHDHRAQLSLPEPELPEGESFAVRAAWALSAFYDARQDIGLGAAAPKFRTALMELYPEGRVFVGGGSLPGLPGLYQSAAHVAGSVTLLERLLAEYPQHSGTITPVLTMLQRAASVGKGLYVQL